MKIIILDVHSNISILTGRKRPLVQSHTSITATRHRNDFILKVWHFTDAFESSAGGARVPVVTSAWDNLWMGAGLPSLYMSTGCYCAPLAALHTVHLVRHFRECFIISCLTSRKTQLYFSVPFWNVKVAR